MWKERGVFFFFFGFFGGGGMELRIRDLQRGARGGAEGHGVRGLERLDRV